MAKDIVLVVDFLDNISVEELADFVYCLDGHGAANVAIFAGGAIADGANASDMVEKLRFDDTVASVFNINNLLQARRAHAGSSNNIEALFGGGENITGSRLSSVNHFHLDDSISTTTHTNNLGASIRHHHSTGTPTEVYFVAGEADAISPDIRKLTYDNSASVDVSFNQLNTARNHAAIAGNGSECIVFEGEDASGNPVSQNEKIRLEDTVQVSLMAHQLSSNRSKADGCSDGQNGIVTGGVNPSSSGEYNTVEKIRFDDLIDVLVLTQTLTNPGYWSTIATDSTHGIIGGGLSTARTTLGTTDVQCIKFDDSASFIHTNGLVNSYYDSVCVSGY